MKQQNLLITSLTKNKEEKIMKTKCKLESILSKLIILGLFLSFSHVSNAQQPCQADFSYNNTDTSGIFFDSYYSTGGNSNIVSWYWDFGDSSTSTLQYPYHTYSAAGTYLACLTITTADSCSDTFCDSISFSTNCYAYFYNSSSQNDPFTVNFTNYSSPAINNYYLWDFDDGSTSTATNPTHLFANSGNYTVCLTIITADSCSDKYCKTVIVSAGQLIVDAGGPSIDLCLGDSATLGGNPTASGGVTPYTYSWTPTYGLDNANVSNPTASPPSGTTTYQLTVTDASGSAAADYVVVNVYSPCDSTCNAYFVFEAMHDSSTTGLGFYFDDLSTGKIGSQDIINWRWNFGDGTTKDQISWGDAYHDYDSAGSYIVCLTITTQDSCTDTYCDTVVAKDCYSNKINLNIVSTPQGCENNMGTATVAASGGTQPYTYAWSNGGTDWTNGQTTQTAYNLTSNYYSVIVTDSNGCKQYAYVYVGKDTSCYGIISGFVYLDMNGNCVKDLGDIALQNVMIKIVPGGYTFTNANGEYYFSADMGTYEVHQVVPSNFIQACPASPGHHTASILTPGAISAGNDFFNDPKSSVQDLRIEVDRDDPVPGEIWWNDIYYYNDGGIPMSGTIEFTHDANVTMDWSSKAPDSYNAANYKATWNFTNLMPGQSWYIWNDMLVSTSVSIGTILTGEAVILPINGDATPPNNTVNFTDKVVSSWDPNDKNVFINAIPNRWPPVKVASVI